MSAIVVITAGGGLGALARHFLSSAVMTVLGGTFPWGILVVNVLGGFLMGIIVELSALKLTLTPDMRAFLTTGLLGGFTTFSTFSLDTVLLAERGDWAGAAVYVGGSVIFSVGALVCGLLLVRAFA